MDIQAEIGRIQELSADELNTLRESILDSAKTAKESIDAGMNSESVQTLTSLAEAANAVKEEDARRATEATELAAQAEAATAAIEELASKPEKDEEEDEDVVVEEIPVEDEEEVPAPVEEAPAPEEEDEDEEETAVEDSDKTPVEEEEPTEDEEKEEEEASVEEVTSEAAVEEAAVEEETPSETEEVEAEEAEPEPETEAEAAVEETEVVEETAAVEEAATEPEEAAVEEAQENKETEVDASVDIERQVDNTPEAAVTAAALPTIVASGSTSVAHAGETLPNIKALANALTDTRKRVRNTGMSNGERDYVGSLVLPEMEDRHLYTSTLDENSRKISDYVDAKFSHDTSLTAAGGLYGPIADYDDVFEFEANTKRPVKDALPGFRADQGGIRYYSPTVLMDLEGAASIWTIEDDVAALEPSNNIEKPSLRVNAGSPVEVVVDAIPLSLTFGNIGNQFYSELAERHIRLGMQLHARVAEQHLITRMATMSTWAKTDSKLGFARDLFVAVETAAAGYRNRNRLTEDASLRVIMPAWAKNAIRADLAMQIPGDSTFSIGDAEIVQWFSDRNIQVTFAYDAESTQYFAAQSDTKGEGELVSRDSNTRIESINEGAKVAGALSGFPENLTWYIFLDGTFLFLDGGSLDLGVVRDSTLNKTNDYQMFLETFEGLAKVGPESVRVSTPVKITGASSGTVDVA